MRRAAFLRAVNVGGTGLLSMAAVRACAEEIGFTGVESLLASGNLIFDAPGGEEEVRTALETALARLGAARSKAFIRTAGELEEILNDNPFADLAPDRTLTVFLDGPPPPDLWEGARGRADEAIAPGARELFVHYPQGQGASKLRLPAAASGSGRNMNTIRKIAARLAAP